MKRKSLLTFLIILLALTSNCQILLENTYSDNSADLKSLTMIKLGQGGYKYFQFNMKTKTINLYNLNHTVYKTIPVPNLPNYYNNDSVPTIAYVSDDLFNSDNLIEYCACSGYWHSQMGPLKGSFRIFNENGSTVFTGDSMVICPQYQSFRWWGINEDQFIYNTSSGTKMILYSYKANDRGMKVYSLPGILNEGIHESNNNLFSECSISNPYPNPTSNITRIDYNLPNNIDEGEIVIYNLQGIEIKRFKVDRTFNTLLISISDIAAGTYYYQLQTTVENSVGKMLLVIK